MPKLRCKCEYIINLSNIPCEHEYMLVPDEVIAYIEMSIDNGKCDSDFFHDVLIEKAETVYRCPQCGRLLIEDDSGMCTPYKREQ